MDSLAAFDLEAFLRLLPNRDRDVQASYFPSIDSTNQTARTRLHALGGPREEILIADKQTAGRGRLGRSWQAPFATGLLCSLTMPLAPLGLERAYLYTASLALSLKAAVWQETEQALDLKWPNDLLRDGRKCCGILAELENVNGTTWLVLGFGLNTGLTERDLAEARLSDKATNIVPFDSEPVSREALLVATLKHLAAYRSVLATDPDRVRQSWADNLLTLGQTVQVLKSDGTLLVSGLAVGVEATGSLLVQDAEGRVHPVQAGDVSVRLPDGRYA